MQTQSQTLDTPNFLGAPFAYTWRSMKVEGTDARRISKTIHYLH